MGGLLILVRRRSRPFLVLSLYTLPGLTVLVIALGCGLIGFVDDYLKVRRRRSLGLPGPLEDARLLVLITVGVGGRDRRTSTGVDTTIYFPIVDWHIDLHWAFYPFLFLVIAGTVNGVNLTDGLDGLAAGTSIISLLTFLAIAVDLVDPVGRRRPPQRQLPRPRHLRRGADRGRDRLPLVQRLPGRGLHGRHRRDGARRRARRRSRS